MDGPPCTAIHRDPSPVLIVRQENAGQKDPAMSGKGMSGKGMELNTDLVSIIRNLDFEFVSSFEIRISDL